MKTKIKIVKNFNVSDKIKLSEFDIKVQVGWDSFEIDQEDIKLFDIKQYFGSEWVKIIQKEVEFSEKDRLNAKYLAVYASKILGYAKPDTEKIVNSYKYPFDIYPYYKDVFEIQDTDENYGVLRGTQIGSYYLKGEPKWGRNRIGSAHYIEDAFFVTPEVYELVFKPLNIKCIPVLDFKTKKELRTVVQVCQQGIANSFLKLTDDNVKETIEIKKWKIKKYILKNEDYFPVFLDGLDKYDFFYTNEYFGDGGNTQRATIISQKLYQLLIQNKITGLDYYPMNNQ